MGVRRVKQEELQRLECKTLDARFRNVVQEGLNCSPFEAEAVLGVVKEVYGPYLDEASASSPPGKITLVAIAADEPAGKAVAQCQTRTVSLTIHCGSPDDRLLHDEGTAAFRRARIPTLCQEALSQDALLTREDLAYRIFFVGVRTISRDLQFLRRKDPVTPIPLRSTVHDIGPVLTHRVQIVRFALEGKTTSQICQIMRGYRGLSGDTISISLSGDTISISVRGAHPGGWRGPRLRQRFRRSRFFAAVVPYRQ